MHSLHTKSQTFEFFWVDIYSYGEAKCEYSHSTARIKMSYELKNLQAFQNTTKLELIESFTTKLSCTTKWFWAQEIESPGVSNGIWHRCK